MQGNAGIKKPKVSDALFLRMWPCTFNVLLYVQPTRCNFIQYSLLLSWLYMFQAVSQPIIRSSKTVGTASGIGYR